MKHHKLLSLFLAAIISTGSIFPISVNAAVTGDLDGDGVATADDLSLLQGYILGTKELTKAQSEAADINGDGKTDVYDVVQLRKTILSSERTIKFTAVTKRYTSGYKSDIKNANTEGNGVAVTSCSELKTALSPYFEDSVINSQLETYNDAFFEKSVLLLKPVYLNPANYQKKRVTTTESCGFSSSYAGIYTTKNVTSYLNIRKEHSASSESIGRIPPDSTITVTAGDGQWAHVTYNDISGYANMDYMQKVSEPAPTYEFLPDIKFDSVKYSDGKLNITASEFKASAPVGFAPALLLEAVIDKKDYYATSTKWDVTITVSPADKYDYPLAKAHLDTVGWEMQAAFNAAASITYYGQKPDMPQDADHSLEFYADFGFKNGKGNCYVMAAMFCEMARLLGYDAHLISGRVPLLQGGYGPHAWTEVNINGSTYVCDPDFANETKRNGYMITYGQSGTWKYTKDDVID